MKSNTHNIKAIAVLWFQLYLHVKLEKQHNILFDWECCTSAATRWTELTHRERGRERCVRAEPSWRTEREGERGVCALNRADAPREREREVCARWTELTHRERGRERCVRTEPSWRTEREGERDVCALNRADAPREREREVCARWTELTHRERGKVVCALWRKTSRLCGSTGDSQKRNKVWVLFWREKNR